MWDPNKVWEVGKHQKLMSGGIFIMHLQVDSPQKQSRLPLESEVFHSIHFRG